MKNDFLPIPDAPNYEINSQLIVRNKTTGRILKTRPRYNTVTLCCNKKRFTSTVASIRRKAIAAKEGGSWLPVPSLNNLYELNEKGLLRNARTKHLIKMRRGKIFGVKINGKKYNVSQKSLLWEVHGILPKKILTPISVTVEFNGEKIEFKSLYALSKFLTHKIYRSEQDLRRQFSRRVAEIAGWKITYHLSQDLTDVTDTGGDWAKVKRTKNVNWLKIGVLTTIPTAKKASD